MQKFARAIYATEPVNWGLVQSATGVSGVLGTIHEARRRPALQGLRQHGQCRKKAGSLSFELSKVTAAVIALMVRRGHRPNRDRVGGRCGESSSSPRQLQWWAGRSLCRRSGLSCSQRLLAYVAKVLFGCLLWDERGGTKEAPGIGKSCSQCLILPTLGLANWCSRRKSEAYGVKVVSHCYQRRFGRGRAC